MNAGASDSPPLAVTLYREMRRLRTLDERFDFDEVRVGIQPFSSDFRGFLFQDSQPGVRFFGNRDNNRWQYNIAYFRPLEKDLNSGLNDVTKAPRHASPRASTPERSNHSASAHARNPRRAYHTTRAVALARSPMMNS